MFFGSLTKEVFVLRTEAAFAALAAWEVRSEAAWAAWKACSEAAKPWAGTTVHLVCGLRGYVSLGVNVFELRLCFV